MHTEKRIGYLKCNLNVQLFFYERIIFQEIILTGNDKMLSNNFEKLFDIR